MKPKYSFIVPAYNEELLIGDSLDVLRESSTALTGGFEIIVVNDASTDRTREIALEKGVRVIDVHKRQIGAVRNAGARVAQGEILIFVDADTHAPKATLLGVEKFLQDPRVVGGGARLVLDQRPPLWGRIGVWIFLFFYFGVANLAAGGFIFARREDFEKVGGFDEKYFAGEEIHLSQALKKLGKLRIVREPVITSGRKFRMKGFREHARLFRHMARKGKKGWENREGLDMWYDGQREK